MVSGQWSVAQVGSNYEKDWRSKISLDYPFKWLFIAKIYLKFMFIFIKHLLAKNEKK